MLRFEQRNKLAELPGELVKGRCSSPLGHRYSILDELLYFYRQKH